MSTTPDTADLEPRFTGARGFGRAFGLSESKVYELMDRGVIRSVRFGGRRLIPVAEAARFEHELQELLAQA